MRSVGMPRVGDYVVRLCPPPEVVEPPPVAMCCVTRHPDRRAVDAAVAQLPRPFARGAAYERAKAAGVRAWDDTNGRMEPID